MSTLFKILSESILQAVHSLMANKLRSLLSILGVAIGIFCLIIVFSIVDTLERNIRSSFEELGTDVLFIHKWSFEDGPPGIGGNYWKYRKRPEPTYKDFEAIKEKVMDLELIGISASIGKKRVSFRNNNVEGGNVMGITEDSAELMGLTFAKGRYFSNVELRTGSRKVILGNVLSEELFGSISAIGKKVKIEGRKLEVIGILEKEGENLVNFTNFDEAIMIPFQFTKQFANLRAGHQFPSTISMKGKIGVSILDLKEEIRGVLRANRQLKPKVSDNFSINEISLLDSVLDNLFFALNSAGGLIGFFALVVGMFSVANIMFVSVKERTNIIGIKKAIGAKFYIILLEFLMESMLLCLLGGLFGLMLIGLLLAGVSMVMPFDLYLQFQNVRLGLLISVFTGILAGIIPAYQAAKLNPVDAINTKY